MKISKLLIINSCVSGECLAVTIVLVMDDSRERKITMYLSEVDWLKEFAQQCQEHSIAVECHDEALKDMMSLESLYGNE